MRITNIFELVNDREWIAITIAGLTIAKRSGSTIILYEDEIRKLNEMAIGYIEQNTKVETDV